MVQIEKRTLVAALCVAALLAGCGSGELSLTEYVDQVNAVVEVAVEKGNKLTISGADVPDFSPQIMAAGITRGLEEIRIPLQEAVDDIAPPDEVADLHDFLWDWHASFIAVEQELVARTMATENTDEGWRALSDSPEMLAYRAALVEGKQVCVDFQSRLDATAQRGVFVDAPWLPSELTEMVEAGLGCEAFPEDPQDVYRYPSLKPPA
ncbi:MAG: hypothetical protein ACR2OI_08500 [Acidimicrobiia bacterium]